jgi:branched-subunit amino acid transport protein
MSTAYAFFGVIGLAVVTVLTRGFFLLIAPEIVLTDGALIATWADARIYAVLVATAYFWRRREILGTIVSGTVVLLVLKIGVGW